MGLLSTGTPLNWDDAKPFADFVRQKGIRQFIKIFEALKDRKRDKLLWGDEVEYILLEFDHDNKKVRVSTRAWDILAELKNDKNKEFSWNPEYGRYMLEGTPGKPYGSRMVDLLLVEENMVERRKLCAKYLKDNEYLVTMTNFPRLGCNDFIVPICSEITSDAAHSLFIPDVAIAKHDRFPFLTANIRRRRGTKVSINVPIFVDQNTPNPFVDNIPSSRYPEPDVTIENHLYMDAMCFGMGCCCLQVTLQACNIWDARYIYDQLTPFATIMLALSAGAPIFRGYLTEVDCRWDVISKSVDDRTPEERGLQPLKDSKHRISKSRYDSVSLYILNDKYNDVPVASEDQFKELLVESGVDHILASHVAHLFIRDPLVIFKEKLESEEEGSTDHFENIQSTNWQTLRFKPPPPKSDIGWRVEFRSMEVQFSDFENAAFSVFIILLTRVIIGYRLNFYMPISLVDSNMKRAQVRDSVLREKFYFRNLFWDGDVESLEKAECCSTFPINSVDDSVSEKTLDEIMNGCNGIIPLIRSYVIRNTDDPVVIRKIFCYLDFVEKRASRKIMTNAAWIRKFVTNHPSYRNDSVVNDEICYDLCREIREIEKEFNINHFQ